METLLEVNSLKKYFPLRRKTIFSFKADWIKAVDGVDFSIQEGKTLSIVGESGCGKTTLTRALLLLEKPTAGSIRFCGQDIRQLKGRALKVFRNSVQAVFQDPYGSLNPRMRIKAIIDEPLRASGLYSQAERSRRTEAAVEEVHLEADSLQRYPHEFSGGQRQRIALARALATRPKLILLDEPVSALDVSVRANILNLLKDLQQQLGLSYLLITHDLATVRHMSDYIGVMYLGRMVESAPSESFYSGPLHPYSRMLLAAAISKGGVKGSTGVFLGEIPSPINPPQGCHFHPRCDMARDICRQVSPELHEVSEGRWVNCHL